MSRSRKKEPYHPITTARSEKEDKQEGHRRERRVVHQALTVSTEAETLPHTRELSNPWAMAKDGKARFDPRKAPELLRK
jgi:hypothetical protein